MDGRVRIIAAIFIIVSLLAGLALAGNPIFLQMERGFLLRDEFITDRSAGAVNSTAAEPGPGVRTVTDTYASTEMVINGGFDSSVTGWSPSNCTLASVAGGQSGNCMEMTAASGSSQNAQVTGIAAIIGLSYQLSVYVKSGTSGNEAFKFGIYDGVSWNLSGGTSSGSWTQYSCTVQAKASSINILVAKSTSTLGTMLFDTVSLKPVQGLLSISNGKLNFAGGKASKIYGDPGLTYEPVARQTGLVGLFRGFSKMVGGSAIMFGLGNTSTSTFAKHGFWLTSGTLLYSREDASAAIANITTADTYDLAVVLRGAGAYHFIKGGAFGAWTLLWVSSTGNSTPLYPRVVGYDSLASLDSIRIPTQLWLPTPVAYDSFTRADGSIGSSEAVGPDGQACGVWGWTNQLGTFEVVSNKAQASALGSGWTIATVQGSSSDVLISAGPTRSSGTVGVVLRYTDANNFLYAGHNGTNAVLVQMASGTPTVIISAAATYSAGAEIRVIAQGDSFSLYYNNAKVGTTATITGFAGTSHGIYSTAVGNIVDNFMVYPRGTGGEYAALDNL